MGAGHLDLCTVAECECHAVGLADLAGNLCIASRNHGSDEISAGH